MLRRDIVRRPPLVRATVVILGTLFFFWVGRQIARDWFNAERLIILSAVVVFGVLFSRLDDSRLRLVLWLAVLSFALGHRSVYVGQWSFFIPSELLFWTLFLLFLSRAALYHRVLLPRIPSSVLVLFLWCLVGIARTPNVLSNWDGTLAWAKQWIVALPIFYVVGALITNRNHIQQAKILLGTVGVYIGALAVVERFVPQVIQALPGFFHAQRSLIITQDGFARSMYTFWGNPIGVILVNWAALILLHTALYAVNERVRWLTIAGTAVCALALYISGQRAGWLSFGVGVIVLGLTSGLRGLALVIVLIPFIFLLPAKGWVRAETVLPGQLTLSDTSLTWRINRWTEALQTIVKHPLLGAGLRGGLVHNEFLSFAARIGLPALIAFVVLLVDIYRRLLHLFWKSHNGEQRRAAQLFLILAATWLVDLNTHPALSHLPVTIPYWFLIALAWRASLIYDTASAPEATHPPHEAVVSQAAAHSGST